MRIFHPALRRPCGCCLDVAVWMCPSRAERKTAAPQGESLPLNARSRSALRGCATCGKKQKATEPPWNGFSRNLQASAFQSTHFSSCRCIRPHSISHAFKTLGQRSRPCTHTSDRPLDYLLHNRSYSGRMRHICLRSHSEFRRDRGLAKRCPPGKGRHLRGLQPRLNSRNSNLRRCSTTAANTC